MTMRTYTVFRPTVLVYDDGEIAVDWSMSWEATTRCDPSDIIEELDSDSPEAQAAAALLDNHVANGVSDADGFRALADRIDAPRCGRSIRTSATETVTCILPPEHQSMFIECAASLTAAWPNVGAAVPVDQ